MAAILVVEDHTDTAHATARLLRHTGHEVRVAASCEAARQCLRTFTPDVLVSDIFLPDGCGAALLRELRPHFPKMRAIAITGSVSDPTSLLGEGFDRVVIKPADFKQVEAAIRAVSVPA